MITCRHAPNIVHANADSEHTVLQSFASTSKVAYTWSCNRSFQSLVCNVTTSQKEWSAGKLQEVCFTMSCNVCKVMPHVFVYHTDSEMVLFFIYREYAKKVCCLGLTSLIGLPASHIPGEALERIFKSTLELLVAYKDQVAGAVSHLFIV